VKNLSTIEAEQSQTELYENQITELSSTISDKQNKSNYMKSKNSSSRIRN